MMKKSQIKIISSQDIIRINMYQFSKILRKSIKPIILNKWIITYVYVYNNI
jgi:hypothetical protein